MLSDRRSWEKLPIVCSLPKEFDVYYERPEQLSVTVLQNSSTKTLARSCSFHKQKHLFTQKSVTFCFNDKLCKASKRCTLLKQASGGDAGLQKGIHAKAGHQTAHQRPCRRGEVHIREESHLVAINVSKTTRRQRKWKKQQLTAKAPVQLADWVEVSTWKRFLHLLSLYKCQCRWSLKFILA